MFEAIRKLLFFLTVIQAILLHSAYCQGIITTIAGTNWILKGDKPATEVPLGKIADVKVDSSGNVFASDFDNQVIVKISADGILSIYAGNQISGLSGDGGPARSASLSTPGGLALDGAGNLYMINGKDRVRMVKPDGTIVTFAGGGSPGEGIGDGGLATAAKLNNPYGVAADAAGNVYITDTGNNRVRLVTPDGKIQTIAGNGGPNPCVPPAPVGDGGPALSTTLCAPQSLALDSKGNVYFTERNSIRTVDSAGIIRTIPGVRALFIAIDPADRLYLISATKIDRMNPDGSLTTLVGGNRTGFSGDGGPAADAQVASPSGISFGATGEIYIADQSNLRVRRISADGTIDTFAGNGNYLFAGDGGAATGAVFNAPGAIAADRQGNLYVADNSRVRKIGADGIITTVVGGGSFSQRLIPAGTPATSVDLGYVLFLATDRAGNLYISGENLLKMTPDGLLSSISVPEPFAQLITPMTADADGNVFVAISNRIRKIKPDGSSATVAGTGRIGLSGDGGPAIEADISPVSLVVDSAGNLYIGTIPDSRNGPRIRKVTPDGIIRSIAGNGVGNSDCGDGGPAVQACLYSASALAVDSTGRLYVGGFNRVRRISTNGIIDTFAGSGTRPFDGDGGPATLASLSTPRSLATDAAGNLYIADSANNRIRKVLADPPDVQVPLQPLTFSVRSGGAAPPARPVNVTSSVPGVAATVATTEVRGVNWLRASLSSPTLPALVQITVDATRLSAGTYNGLVTIRTPAARITLHVIPVLLVVAAANPPRLAFAPGNLSYNFTVQNDSPDPASQLIIVSNRGDGSLAFTAQAAEAGWLTVSPQSGTATSVTPGAVTAVANPIGVRDGTYNARVTLRSTTTSESLDIPVSMTVTTVAARRSIRLSQTGLSFQAVAGPNAGDVTQTFAVLNTGTGVMNWSAAARTQSGGPWLLLKPGTGATDAASLAIPEVKVGVDAGGLPPGRYQGEIQVSAPDADNSPQSVQVVLDVLASGANARPIIQRTGLVFAGLAGGVSPASQQTGIVNYRPAKLDFRSIHGTFDGGNWYNLLPTDGTIDSRTTETITIQPDLTGLSPGIYNGAITLMFKEYDSRNVNVLLVVAPQGGAGQAVAKLGDRAAGSSCRAGVLRAVFTQLSPGFVAEAGVPLPLEIKVIDDCGEPMTGGSVLATFSNGDAALTLLSLKDGRWTGTWFPKNAAPSGITISIHAQGGAQNLRYDTSLDGTLAVTTQP